MSIPGRRHARLADPDQRWLITGTGRGLGAELARRVQTDLGAGVLGVDRSAPPSPAAGDRVRADLATRAGLDEVVTAMGEWQPTVLVNCAATDQSRTVAETDDALADELFEVGFRTPYLIMREIVRLGAEADRPVWVINIVSPYRLVGVRTHSLYCATKAALSRAGESLAAESLDAPVQVISVVPGAFNSGFRPVQAHDAWLVRAYRQRGARTPEAVAAELLGRLCRPSSRRHRTIRLGWDGKAFELAARALASDVFLVGLDRLIGQRQASATTPSDTTPSDP